MIPVARLHPLVRATTRAGIDSDDRITFLSTAARLLRQAAAAGETGLPEDPPMWPIWQLLTPHAALLLDDISAKPQCPDGTTEAAAYAAYLVARYQASQGHHARAESQYRDVLAASLRVLGPDHPYTLAARHAIATEIAARGDHASAEAEYRDLLTTKLRVLGPDHPDTLLTSAWIDYLEGLKSS